MATESRLDAIKDIANELNELAIYWIRSHTSVSDSERSLYRICLKCVEIMKYQEKEKLLQLKEKFDRIVNTMNVTILDSTESTKKLNQLLADNGNLKTQLDNAIREKDIQHIQCERLEDEKRNLKKTLIDVVRIKNEKNLRIVRLENENETFKSRLTNEYKWIEQDLANKAIFLEQLKVANKQLQNENKQLREDLGNTKAAAQFAAATKPFIFNINRRATVILTKAGAEVVNVAYKSLVPITCVWYNEGNVYSTELWNLMEVFGKSLYNGGPTLFLKNEIQIE
jgi:regulator of replication initiation timing